MGGCLSFVGLGGRRVGVAALMAIKKCSLDEKYEQIKELGKGAGGVAILVKDKKTGKLSVAKKAIRDSSKNKPQLYSNEQDFLREIHFMKELSHINILSTVGHLQAVEWCDATQGPVQVNYVFTEFAEGGDLAAYLAKVYHSCGCEHSGRGGSGGIPEQMLAKMLLQPLLGTAYLHGQDLVHNDIKPENVLVMDQLDPRQPHKVPKCVLTDFGNVLRSNETVLASFGDPRYRAPEAWDADVNNVEIFDSRSLDVWSFGVMLFELLSGGSIPYLYEHVTLEQISENAYFEKLTTEVLKGQEVDLSHCRTGSADAQDVLRQALRLETSQRATVTALIENSWFNTNDTTDGQQVRFLDDTCLRKFVLHESKTQVHTAFQNVLARTLSGRHKEECQRIFAKADVDNNGRLSRIEFQTHLSSLASPGASPGATEEEADKLFSKADLDGDNSLTVNEFVAVTFNWSSMSKEQIDRHLEDVIQEWDSDNDGFLTYEDLLARLKGFVTEKTLKSVFENMDLDGDGKLSKDELNEFLFVVEVQRTPSQQARNATKASCLAGLQGSCAEFYSQRFGGGKGAQKGRQQFQMSRRPTRTLSGFPTTSPAV